MTGAFAKTIKNHFVLVFSVLLNSRNCENSLKIDFCQITSPRGKAIKMKVGVSCFRLSFLGDIKLPTPVLLTHKYYQHALFAAFYYNEIEKKLEIGEA